MWNPRTILLSAICLICAFSSNCNAATVQPGKQKVCVIGAGPSGLTSAKQLADNSDLFDIVVFEKNAEVGGTWLYTNRTDVDEHNLTVTTAMYRDLRVNIPKEILSFPDYRDFNGENRSCVYHETVLEYLKNFTNHFHLYQYLQLNTLVENVKPVPGEGDCRTTKHLVQTRNLANNVVTETLCDAVMVTNGHYSKPNVPKIPGIESFPGKVMHSLTYRVPETFSRKTVLVLGAASSGIDIAIEISRHALKVYLSHNHPKITSPLVSNLIQVSGVAQVLDNKLLLKDGSNLTDVDIVIFCTGFNYNFPFLKEESGITVDHNYVSPLYKHVLHVENPSLGFVGLPLNAMALPTAYIQAKYFVALLKGDATLPAKEVMIHDSQLNGKANKLFHNLGDDQWAYHKELADAGNFDTLPNFYKAGYNNWMAYRNTDFVNFRESNLVILDNGDVEIVQA